MLPLRRHKMVMGAAIIAACAASGCGNSPYPAADARKKVYYGSLMRSYALDPVNAQGIPGLGYLGAICEPLFEYHYLKRPLELQPLLARSVPSFEPIVELDDAPGALPRQLYRLRLEIWDGVLFHRSVCFDAPAFAEPRTRELTADDFEFTFMRIADSKNACPAIDSFARIDGLRAWGQRLDRLRAENPAVRDLSAREQYRRVGPIPGVRVTGRYRFDLMLTEKFPILMYWLAYSIASPVPPEVVAYYDGKDGRRPLREWPIGTGPYRIVAHDLGEFIAFEKNPDWRGITQPQRRLPGTYYPTEGAPGDREAGLLAPEYVGRPLPFIDRFEYRRDKEIVSRFGKFVQGYYDDEEIVEETANQAMAGAHLTRDLVSRGIRLDKQVQQRVWYFAFNMNDDVVGAPAKFKDPQREAQRDVWIERNRKLRQAMCLAHDARKEIDIFMNGRATKAEGPIPPGVFGYDPNYRNPYRQYDPQLVQARRLMVEAGYPGGIDPRTGRPLRIVMTVSDTDARSMELFKLNQQMFGRIGVDVVVDAMTYNSFVRNVESGSFQLCRWGWFADYPDPLTFLVLLYGPESAMKSKGVNLANFDDPRYNALYDRVITMADDDVAEWTEPGPDGTPRTVRRSRLDIINEMVRIVERECPWIINHYPQMHGLYPSWYRNVKPHTVLYTWHKYRDIDAPLRAQRREAWNRMNTAPAYVLAAVLLAVLAPAVRTYWRRTRR